MKRLKSMIARLFGHNQNHRSAIKMRDAWNVRELKWRKESFQMMQGIKEADACFAGNREATSFIDSFYEAAEEGNLEKVKTMLKGNPDLVFCKRVTTTPLHEAAARGHKAVVELLLANNAEIDARGDNGRTPLHWAAVNGKTDIVKLLLANNAEVNPRNEDGKTPLALASARVNDEKWPQVAAQCKVVAEMLRHHGGQY